jgi:hypothetical protein
MPWGKDQDRVVSVCGRKLAKAVAGVSRGLVLKHKSCS